MKITKTHIKQIIKEELQKVLNEREGLEQGLEELLEDFKHCFPALDKEDVALGGKLFEAIVSNNHEEAYSIATQLVTTAPEECKPTLTSLVEALKYWTEDSTERGEESGLFDLMEQGNPSEKKPFEEALVARWCLTMEGVGKNAGKTASLSVRKLLYNPDCVPPPGKKCPHRVVKRNDAINLANNHRSTKGKWQVKRPYDQYVTSTSLKCPLAAPTSDPKQVK